MVVLVKGAPKYLDGREAVENPRILMMFISVMR